MRPCYLLGLVSGLLRLLRKQPFFFSLITARYRFLIHWHRILKSIWYRMNNFNSAKPTRLSKVYFTWVIRDFGVAEWFHSLLHAIEEQDTQNRIEINIYLTAKIKEDDMNNIIVCSLPCSFFLCSYLMCIMVL